MIFVGLILGFIAGRMLWLAMRQSWSQPTLMRVNFQGTELPTAAGITIALTLLLVEGIRAVVAAAGFGDDPGLTPIRAAALIAVIGFSLFGLIDDMIGTSKSRGLGGHFKALARGDLTTGMVKLVGGIATSFVCAALISQSGTTANFPALILTAGIIALTANLINLFDLRPGRATKVGLLTFVIVAIVGGFDSNLTSTAIAVGAAFALILDDLHERLMIGDTGANALGAVLGVGLAANVSGTGRIVTFAVLLGLNLASEVISFTKIIQAVAPLRALDNLGRRRPPLVDLRDQPAPNVPAPSASPTPSRATIGGALEGSAQPASAGSPRESLFNDSDDLFAGRFDFQDSPVEESFQYRNGEGSDESIF